MLTYGILYICYIVEHPWIERYKCLPDPWPWKDEENKEAWNKLYWRTIFFYLLNAQVITPFLYAPFWIFDEPLLLDITMEGIPSTAKLFGQLLFCVMVEDAVFYLSHRSLHHPFFYHHIHKIHHEHKMTVGIAAQYAHPLEYVFGNLLPIGMGPAILGKRIHFLTAYAWYTIRLFESVDGHSGYEFSWSPFRILPFATDLGYHVYHHSHNIGNYGSFFTFWDTIYGTNSVYHTYLREKREEDKQKKVVNKNK